MKYIWQNVETHHQFNDPLWRYHACGLFLQYQRQANMKNDCHPIIGLWVCVGLELSPTGSSSPFLSLSQDVQLYVYIYYRETKKMRRKEGGLQNRVGLVSAAQLTRRFKNITLKPQIWVFNP